MTQLEFLQTVLGGFAVSFWQVACLILAYWLPRVSFEPPMPQTTKEWFDAVFGGIGFFLVFAGSAFMGSLIYYALTPDYVISVACNTIGLLTIMVISAWTADNRLSRFLNLS